MKLHIGMFSILDELYRNGKSCQEIATKYEVTHSTVSKFLRKHGTIMRTMKEAKIVDFARPGRKISRYWLGKKQPIEMVEKRLGPLKGSGHGMYKDGSCMRTYRKGVIKDLCALCKSTKSLAIHHKDFDHYNNDPANLQILCLSCHSRVHKNEYWKNVKAGRAYKTNAPNHWK